MNYQYGVYFGDPEGVGDDGPYDDDMPPTEAPSPLDVMDDFEELMSTTLRVPVRAMTAAELSHHTQGHDDDDDATDSDSDEGSIIYEKAGEQLLERRSQLEALSASTGKPGEVSAAATDKPAETSAVLNGKTGEAVSAPTVAMVPGHGPYKVKTGKKPARFRETAPQAGVALDRNIFKELGKKLKRSVGLEGKPMTMRTYPQMGSHGVSKAILDYVAAFDKSSLTGVIKSLRESDTEWTKVFSEKQYTTRVDKCSIYVMDKKVRQVLDNKRVTVASYYPLEGKDRELDIASNFVIEEYNLRNVEVTKGAPKGYSLSKLGLLKKPPKGQEGAQAFYQGVQLDLSLGKAKTLHVLPDINVASNDAKEPTGPLADDLWFTVGEVTKGKPMVIFRFGPKKLDFIYVVRLRQEANVGLGAVMSDALASAKSYRAAKLALQAIASEEMHSKTASIDERASVGTAAHRLAAALAEIVRPLVSETATELLALRLETGPGTSAIGLPPEANAFYNRFHELFSDLGDCCTDAEDAFCGPQASLDAFLTLLGEQPMETACLLSQMTNAVQNRLTRTDANERVRLLWSDGHDALHHFAFDAQ